MVNLSEDVYRRARELNDDGQIQLAYQVLAGAGDNYSAWAATIP